jgi:MFS family permease
MSNFDIGLAGAVYVAGGCLGTLVFGQLTDRFGRKKLFLITLAVYTIATVLTAFSPSPLWYFACRFLTGAGIGGEYAAINSAIDELIPAHYRGRVDIVINGSFWIGAVGGALLTIPLLDPTKVDTSIGWRLAFGLGAILALGVFIVRRHVPESPRWLFIHGREDEGDRIVTEIEEQVIFPLETRALCIAFFYGVGTAAGGIAGPLLFGALIQNASSSGDITKIAVGYFIGAALMVAGGVVEAIFGVSAERQALENIAMPLTAADPEGQTDAKRPAASPA